MKSLNKSTSIKNTTQVNCKWHTTECREFYVDENMRVLPCCYYASGLRTLPDPVLQEYEKNNPGWNDLSQHKMDDIVASEIYQNHLWLPGWKNNPSELCIKNCGWKYRTPDEFETDPDDPASDD